VTRPFRDQAFTGIAAALIFAGCHATSSFGNSVSTETKSGLAAVNSIDIQVGGPNGEHNIPFVSVTICSPGTDHCQTIDRIVLDTGSSGLRIFSSLVRLSLPASLDKNGKSIAECMLYGGGASEWGAVVVADVILGSGRAKDTPIQLWDAQFGSRPSSCPMPASTPELAGSNGTLGISNGLTDCFGNSCPQSGGEPYYLCDGTGCTPFPISVQQLVQNPISRLSTDNNGVTVFFPPVPAVGATGVKGKLIMGVGTNASNQPPAKTTPIPATYDGWFKGKLNGGIAYWARMDTGTQAWGLPSDNGTPLCTGAGASRHYLCPVSPEQFAISVEDFSGAQVQTLSFEISNADSELSSGNLVFNNIAQSWGAGISNDLIFGMPFFYGKSVYFVFDGKSSPLGLGPVVGFNAN